MFYLQCEICHHLAGKWNYLHDEVPYSLVEGHFLKGLGTYRHWLLSCWCIFYRCYDIISRWPLTLYWVLCLHQWSEYQKYGIKRKLMNFSLQSYHNMLHILYTGCFLRRQNSERFFGITWYITAVKRVSFVFPLFKLIYRKSIIWISVNIHTTCI